MTPNPSGSSSASTGRSRYPGTRPFGDSPEEHALFFGRGEESELLYLRVLSVPLVVQFGKSGLGKTSLLQAALFPRLRQKTFLPVMVRLNVPTETPAHVVADSIQQACQIEGLEFTPARADGLWDLLSTTTVWRDDLLLTPVIVFDQFEEVFTLRDANFRSGLATELGGIFSGTGPERSLTPRSGGQEQTAARPNVKIVISLREDYLGALEEFSAAIPNLFHERLRLEPLNDEAAREAIIRPAQLASTPDEEPYLSPCFEFERAALDSMVTYLKGTSGVIESFQLQLLCRYAETIATRKSTSSPEPVKLGLADFGGSEGFDSVLKNFYRDTLLQLDGSQRRKAAELCEEGLLDGSGHRLMLEEGQIRNDFGITLQSLAILSYERLLRRERRLESAFYEISHDRLAESILRAKRFRLPKRVKRALWTAAIMAPVVLAGLLLWVASLGVAKRKIDNLNGFLLGNFLEEVRDIGRSTMLGEVQEKIKDVGDVDQMSGLNRGLALRNRGDLERTYGSVAAASTLYAEATKAFEKSPDEPHQQRALARTHERLGDALADQGKVTEALTSYEAAIRAWRRVVSNSAPVENKDCTSLADSLVSAGELYGRLGETTRALNELEEATAISSSILFPYHRSPNGCGVVSDIAAPYPDAKALGVTSHAALLRATILNFPEDYEGTAALAMEARRLNPTSISTREQALTALAWRGNGRLSTPQRAIADYQTALKGFEALRRWDPTNRGWQRQRAANLLILGDGIVACQANKANVCTPALPLEEAEAIDLEAVASLRALSSKDPENVSWQEDLGWALQEEARVLAASNRHAERLAMVEKAEPLFRGCQRESADTECPEKLGELLMDKSDAMIALERVAEARQSIKASDEVFQRLIAAHPDDPTFVYDLSEARKKEAEILRKAGDAVNADAAAAENKRLLEKYRALTGVREKPADELHSALLAHNREGNKLVGQKRYTAALREYDAAESAGRKYVSLRPANAEGYDNLRVVYQSINYSQEKLGNAKERAIALNAAMQVAQIAALLARADAQTTANASLLEARHQFGAFLYDNNRLDDALAMVQEEIAVADSLVDENKQSAFYLWQLGNAQCGLGMLRRKHQNGPGWEEAIRSGLIQEQKAVEIDSRNADYLNEVAHWREYLAGELKADGRKEEALAEYQLALKTYQEAVKRFPGNETAEKRIQGLAGQGIQ